MLFSREEIFAKNEFEIYLPAKNLPAKISSRELFPCRKTDRVTSPPVCVEGIEQ